MGRNLFEIPQIIYLLSMYKILLQKKYKKNRRVLQHPYLHAEVVRFC